MADKITWANEKRKLSELVPWERNPRQITDKQAKRLEESFEQFGQVEIIAIGPENQIYNGHQRLKVLSQKYGSNYEVDVRVASRALTEKEREKLTIFLHKGAAGDWDFDVLANEFELDDLLNWGFEPKELDLDLWAGDPPEDVEPQIDKAEELREKWGVELGQLWKLGEHRIICGDCTDKAVVNALMQGERAGAVITDPPYGLGDAKSFNDNHPDYEDSEPFDLSLIDLSVPFVVFGGNYYDYLPMPRIKIGWIVWDKRPDLEGDKRERADRIFGQHFEIAVTSIGDLRGKMYRQRWGGYYGNQEIFHKTQKPPELFEWCIKPTEGIILDYFLGSGTTIIACERLGRKCRAIEISPAYCAVAIQRWVDVTGKEPVLLES